MTEKQKYSLIFGILGGILLFTHEHTSNLGILMLSRALRLLDPNERI